MLTELRMEVHADLTLVVYLKLREQTLVKPFLWL
jgi:hypothetical protein